jgi:uncharacterized membrane protein YfcA
MDSSLMFLVSLLAVAIMYSIVGHGGASGYLAIMTVFAVSTVYFRSSALILNLFVAGIAFISFNRGYTIRWRLFLPFLLPAIPMAFIGALVHLNPGTYKFLLGIMLLLALMRLLYRPSREYEVKPPPGVLLSVAIGSLLGLLSGMIGIGGGILLSPIFILMRWTHVKETGVYSSLFILCNSLAGIAGLIPNGIILPPHFIYWILIVAGGGLIGSTTAIKFLPARYFKISLAIVLLFACFKLLIP